MRPHPRRARTNPSSPRAWGTSDKNGMVSNLETMRYQYEWAGTQLINTRSLVSPDEIDVPQRQLGTIFIPPDPPVIGNTRPEQYSIDEVPVSARYTLDGQVRITVGYPIFAIRIISGDTSS